MLQERGQHRPCPLPQHGAVLHAGPGHMFTEGLSGAERVRESNDMLGREQHKDCDRGSCQGESSGAQLPFS